MRNISKNRLFAFISAPILFALALFFAFNSFISQNVDIVNYQHTKALLMKFECTSRPTGERYYYFYFNGKRRYWSYVNREDWPNCEEAQKIFSTLVNKKVEIWLKDFQVVQFKHGTDLLFSVEDYVGSHRKKGYQHAAFFLFLVLIVILYTYKKGKGKK